MKFKMLFISIFLWAGLLLFFWNTLYGFEKSFSVAKQDLFDYTSSSIGIQAPFLHATSYLLLYLILLICFFSKNQIYYYFRLGKKKFYKYLLHLNYGFSIYFIIIYALTYTFCLCKSFTFQTLLENDFFLTLLFYMLSLISYYCLFGNVSIMLIMVLNGRLKSIIATILISVIMLFIYYNFNIPTPYAAFDVFDMAYYKGGIVIFTYMQRITFNVFLMFIFEYLIYVCLAQKDVMKNEVIW